MAQGPRARVSIKVDELKSTVISGLIFSYEEFFLSPRSGNLTYFFNYFLFHECGRRDCQGSISLQLRLKKGVRYCSLW